MLRCGFAGGAPESFDVIGRRLGVTRERVRQIEDTALR
jgi:DNA-directed RNA polymerase sigma subunit (sigma70/sigma32)